MSQSVRLAKLGSTLSVVAAALWMVGCGPSPAYQPVEYPAAPAPLVQRDPEPEPPPVEAPAASEMGAPTPENAQAQAPGEIEIGAEHDEYGEADPRALTDFKEPLAGHGEWVDDSTYGTVWVPATTEVGSDFEPYVTAGHWTYSDTTNYVWVSDYSWGWAPFHYGRWVALPGRGWAWIPGRRYAGAWVTWRTGVDGYVGWAPAAPDWYWYNGVAIGWGFGWYHPHYVYCGYDYFYRPYFSGYVIRGEGARWYDAHSRPFVPASPVVTGERRVAAAPTVAGHTTPSFARGPRPDDLGMNKAMIVPPPARNSGLERAQAFAAPSAAHPANGFPGTVSGIRGASVAGATVPTSRSGVGAPVGAPVYSPSAARAPVASGYSPAYRGSSAYSASSVGRSSVAQPYRATPTHGSSYAPSRANVGVASARPSAPSARPSASSVAARPSAPSVSRSSAFSPSASHAGVARSSSGSFRASSSSVRSSSSRRK